MTWEDITGDLPEDQLAWTIVEDHERQGLLFLGTEFGLFVSVDDGEHFLVTPAEKLRIRVDDAPFVATDMETDGEGRARRILFTTNVEDVVLADGDHPIVVEDRAGEPRPYVEVRGMLRALIARSVFYRLVDLACEGPDGKFFVWSSGTRFVLG